MFHRIKNYFNKEYSRALTMNSEDKRISVSSVAGRLLIIFFLAMFVFTFVSRAAASFTVAKVSVSSPKRDRLFYSISGIGEIIPIEEELILLEPGYRVEDVYVSTGEKVSKDSVLFGYNMKDLQDKYDSLQNEIEKTKLQISVEKQKLQPADSLSSKTSLLSVRQAQENLDVANNNLAEAIKVYEDSIRETEAKENKDWQKEYEHRQKQYNTAKKNYESVLFSQEKQLMQSSRMVDDAKAVLVQINEKYGQINPLIDDYIEAVQGEDEGAIYRAGEALNEAFYGGVDSYEDHVDAVFNTAIGMQQEGTYLWYIRNYLLQCNEQINNILKDLKNAESNAASSDMDKQTYESLKKRYKQAWSEYSLMVDDYERQIDAIEDGLDIRSGELKRLRRDDKRLKEYLIQLRIAIKEKTELDEPRQKLYDFVMGDKEELINKEINSATLAVSRAEEDHELLEKEFDMVRTNLQLELTELKDTIISIENETYDYSDALEGKIQAVRSAEEAVRMAKQVVISNKLQYEMANNPSSNQATIQMTELNIKNYYIDLHKAEKELQEVNQLIEASGEVLSPSEGVITHIGLEAGRSTTGEELIKIGTGNYVLKGAFIRDKNISIQLGGDVEVTLAGNTKPIDSEVGKISINKEGMTEFISSLPQGGDYYLGEKAEFKISTESE
ncbi:MAG: hypothetical protein PHC56_13175, partial [Herbinix sp.]|nr:hypothetical protein [Herbinix sp.]